MEIDQRSVGEIVILDLKGKITLGEGDELLKDKVNSLVNQGHKKVVLNLAAVPYIDSAGLGDELRSIAAFAVFCALSSAVYLINDIADRDSDRRHPFKAMRPIASGALPVAAAITAAAVIGTVALAGAIALGSRFAVVALGY